LHMAYLVTGSTLAQAGVLLLQVYKGGAVLLPKWMRPRRCNMHHALLVARHTSHVTRHTSHVSRHASHVTRHASHVKPQVQLHAAVC
jgi:hypothetical protein